MKHDNVYHCDYKKCGKVIKHIPPQYLRLQKNHFCNLYCKDKHEEKEMVKYNTYGDRLKKPGPNKRLLNKLYKESYRMHDQEIMARKKTIKVKCECGKYIDGEYSRRRKVCFDCKTKKQNERFKKKSKKKSKKYYKKYHKEYRNRQTELRRKELDAWKPTLKIK